MSRPQLTLVGRAEEVSFAEVPGKAVPARIDTGAKTSAIWASRVTEHDGELQVVLFGPESPYYTGEVLHFREYSLVGVASSTGEIDMRFKVLLHITMKGKRVRAGFTLADRATQAYPVLIGRNVLRGKFIVDVKQGIIQTEAELDRRRTLREAREKYEHEESV